MPIIDKVPVGYTVTPRFAVPASIRRNPRSGPGNNIASGQLSSGGLYARWPINSKKG